MLFFLLRKPHKPFPAFSMWRTPAHASKFRTRNTSCNTFSDPRPGQADIFSLFSLLLCYSLITQPMIVLILSFLWNGDRIFSSWYCQTLVLHQAQRRGGNKNGYFSLKNNEEKECAMVCILPVMGIVLYCDETCLQHIVGLHYKTIQHGGKIHRRCDNFIQVREMHVFLTRIIHQISGHWF